MKKIKRNLIILVVLIPACAGYGFYMYKKKPTDIRKEEAQYQIDAAVLLSEFNKDETAANKKYIDKIIAVQGKVADIKIDTGGEATVFLASGDPMASVTCSFYREETPSVKQIKQGELVIVKGKCTGKLMDVVLNKCSLIK